MPDKEKEREFKLPESLVIDMLNFLLTNPAVQLMKRIETTVNQQVKIPGKKEEE